MNLQKIKRFFVVLIATALGSGFTPKAPGTAGTVVGVLMVMGLDQLGLSLPIKIGLFVGLFLIGWWASWEWSKLTQLKDAQTIVIDEVLGYWLTILIFDQIIPVAALGPNFRWVVGFLAFRMFDVLKPPPIRQLDRYGKKFEIGAFQSAGVIVDDLLAGVYAALLMVVMDAAIVASGMMPKL